MAIVAMFVMAIILWTLDLAKSIMEAKLTLIESSDGPIDSKLDNAHAFIFRMEAVQDVLYAYMSLLGDAIIIHRAWKLQAFSGCLWVLFVPCAFLVGSLVATVMLTSCVAQLGSHIVGESFGNPLCTNIQILTYVMPTANIAVATSLIGITVWKYRKSVGSLLRDDDNIDSANKKTKCTQVERILVLLVESGILYFLFFATQIVLGSLPVYAWIDSSPGLTFALKIYSYSSSVIVGLYPTMLIVLARSKHNVLDRAAASSCATALSSIRIAQVPVNTETDRRTATGTWTTIEFVARRSDEIELESRHDPLSHNDEEKAEIAHSVR
ncbi:hypothetical protein B0H17DRAFT_1218534 [Mycena rosella]|uniref:Uncharacterized protein n=1 Tax=Mycena rosella TaxID=1033263 RepID=A0AAD7FLE9_MYCRO|nr:hypothetical protein B0H17DRAFT_1218534 [Mycena rosella]